MQNGDTEWALKKWKGVIDVRFSARWHTGEQNKWTAEIPFWAEAQREEI